MELWLNKAELNGRVQREWMTQVKKLNKKSKQENMTYKTPPPPQKKQRGLKNSKNKKE